MSTWRLTSFRLDPWSYQNLLLKQYILQETANKKLSKASALRYVLRRLRFTDEQKAAYVEMVHARMVDEDVPLPDNR